MRIQTSHAKPPRRRRNRAPCHLLALVLSAVAEGQTIVDEGGCMASDWTIEVDGTSDGRTAPPRTCIGFELNRPCRVILRVVGRGGNPETYRTLVDHEVLGGGSHFVTWDGKDATGNDIGIQRAQFTLQLAATSLPRFPAESCAHAQSAMNRRRDFVVDILQPGQAHLVSADTLVVEAIAREGSRGMGDALGYYVSWLLDETQYLGSDEESELPFVTRTFDTSGWAPGDHVLRVIYYDKHKHHGSASLKLTIPPR